MKQKAGLYILRGGSLEGVVGIVGCDCDVPGPDSIPEDYLVIHLERDPARTLVHKSSVQFIGDLKETTDIAQRFMKGESISNLPDGSEDFIRGALKLATGRVQMYEKMHELAQKAFEKVVAKEAAPPKSARD